MSAHLEGTVKFSTTHSGSKPAPTPQLLGTVKVTPNTGVTKVAGLFEGKVTIIPEA